MKDLQWLGGPLEHTLNGDKAQRAVVCLHGFGDHPRNFMNLSKHIAMPNCLWLAPRGVGKTPMGMGYQWFETYGDPFPQLEETLKQLELFFKDLPAKTGLPLEKTFLLGFSQGAMVTLKFALENAFPLAGIIALNGLLFPSTQEEHRQRKNIPIMLCHGEQDTVILPFWHFDALRFLKKQGYTKVSHHLYPHAHDISPDNCKDIFNFIKENG